jgi:integrase
MLVRAVPTIVAVTERARAPGPARQLAATIAVAFPGLVRFDAYTGLRAGELAALRVGRLDLLRGACEVVESATEVDGKLVWGATKTYERRTVLLPRFLCEEVGAYLASRSRSRWTAMGTCSPRSWTTSPTASTGSTRRLLRTQRVPTPRVATLRERKEAGH